jgi:hypothetical protein
MGNEGIELNWELGKGDQDAEVWVRAVGDREVGPGPLLHVSRGSGKITLDPGRLPPGTSSLELVAHDGFNVTTSEHVQVEVSKRPPVVAVLHPLDHQTLPAGRTLRLHGLATSADGQPVSPERCRWLVDGDEAGRGLDLWAVAPAEGEHRVTLIAEDEAGQAERTVTFRTVSMEGRPDDR